jgi:acetyltransferase-like isoleucine patch superfamily enzyme
MKAVKQISISNTPYNICDIGLRNTLGGAAQEIKWNAELNLDTFTRAGIYRIKGERLSNTDNIPINNSANGHTIDASLQVLNSSLTNGSGENTDICVTQILTLSNRVGGDGDIYIRTGRGINEYSISWEQWGKLQTNIEVGIIDEYGLNNYIDNGIYSGATNNGDTFVMIVINNYALAGLTGYTRHISQLMYSVYLDGIVRFMYRTGEGNEKISWNEWKRTLSDSINYTTKNYKSFAEAKIDTDGLSLSIGSYNNTYRSITINPCDSISDGLVSFNRGDYTAVIGANVDIKTDVVIGAKVNIGEEIKIGNKTDIGAGVIISNSVTIGTSTKIYKEVNIGTSSNIHNNVNIGTSTYIGKEIHIGEKVNIGTSVTIPKGLTISTITLEGNIQGLKFTYDGKSTTLQLT